MEPGTRLGPYAVQEQLGAGGMGEVYRARDTTLDRDVAIKVLPAALAEDTERLARFEREAKVLASLNHPNIAGIHGLHRERGQQFIVMECVPGAALSERITASGPLEEDEALTFARQIADALAAAHAAGVVHRDIKPANVQITPEGEAKVLDFGLAGHESASGPVGSSPDQTQSPTVAVATMAGVILGTAAYMSPEQARGKPVDARTDIWSFGCVLYEMLVGRRAFAGETVSDTMAAILKEEPDWDAVASVASPPIVRLLRRCLAKDPRQRLHAIADARIEIDDALGGQTWDEPARVTSGGKWKWLGAGLALGSLTALGVMWVASPTPTATPRQLTLSFPNLARIGFATLSPTGRHVAFIGEERLWVRPLEEAAAREIRGTERASNPFWSPDGDWIAYFVARRVFKVQVAGGGSPVPVTTLEGECGPPACGGAWTSDGRLLLSHGDGGVWSVPETGGEPTSLIPPTETEHYHQVYSIPNGPGLLVTVDPDAGPNRLDVWDGERRTPIAEDAVGYGYAAGHVLYGHDNAVWALPFSSARLEPTGEPFVVVASGAHVTASDDGALLYRVEVSPDHQLVWVDRNGLVDAVVDDPDGQITSVALSPDGSKIAVALERRQIWVLDPDRGARTPLKVAPGIQDEPAWSADGGSVFYVGSPPDSSDDDELLVREQSLATGEDRVVAAGFEPAVTADGRRLVFSSGDFIGRDVHYLDLDRDAAEVAVTRTPTMEAAPSPSGDGSHIAYVASATGMTATELYLSRFPSGAQPTRVSGEGGAQPVAVRWARDDSRLYYVRRSDGFMMEVEVTLGEEPRLGEPRELFDPRVSGLDLDTAGFDVSADGSRFLAVRQVVPRGAQRTRWILESNWLSRAR